ncbi:MAG TPA: methyltransferase domain-containing protein [Steroidobacteraceae bacterium]|nr:methyltransferase domain-containing protein [Steroidobacteraceae bacterium]
MLPKLKTVALLATCALFLDSCAAQSSRESTTEELTALLAGSQRAEENRVRDVYRHPKQTLLFFGVRPEMSVLEVWPTPGYYTEILAPLLREKGKYYAAVMAADPSSKYVTRTLENYRAKLAASPQLYDKVIVVTMPTDGGNVVPPGSLDMALTFRNLHNWMSKDDASQVIATLYKALKPGGILGIVEHRGNPAVAQDPKAKSGYVNEDYAIKLIEAQGFRLVAKSEVNANPKDTKDYPQGVWTLPPTYELGDKDREKYAAIGESDRFTMRFQKPPL